MLVLPFVLERPEFILKLSGRVLGDSWAKKREPEFPLHSTDIASLAKLVNAGLGRGILHDNLELSIAHCRVQHILRGSEVIHVRYQPCWHKCRAD